MISLFETPVEIVDLPGIPNDALAALLLDEATTAPTWKRANVGGWHSTPDLGGRPPFAPLMRAIVDAVSRHVVMASPASRSCRAFAYGVTAWAMILRDGDYVTLHDHGDVHWSVAYYVDAGDDVAPPSGRLAFVDPRRGGRTIPELFPTTFELAPRTGSLVIFPGWLQHFVHPYPRPAPARICVSAEPRDGAGLKITIVGAGPGGLCAARILGTLGHDVTVLERRARDAAHGLGHGITLPDAALAIVTLGDADPALALTPRWDTAEVRVNGETFAFPFEPLAGISRAALVAYLVRRCEGAGVAIQFDTTVDDPARLAGDCDLLIGADGVGSVVRAAFPFGEQIAIGDNPFAWLAGDDGPPHMRLVFEQTSTGMLLAALYPYAADRCTVIVEGSPDGARPTHPAPDRRGAADPHRSRRAVGALPHRPHALPRPRQRRARRRRRRVDVLRARSGHDDPPVESAAALHRRCSSTRARCPTRSPPTRPSAARPSARCSSPPTRTCARCPASMRCRAWILRPSRARTSRASGEPYSIRLDVDSFPSSLYSSWIARSRCLCASGRPSCAARNAARTTQLRM